MEAGVGTGRNFPFYPPGTKIVGIDISPATGLAPLRPGPAGYVQRRPSPVGGGSAEHLEMAECLIFKRLLKIISNLYAENAKKPGKPPLPDVQAYFHGHAGRLDCWISRATLRMAGPMPRPNNKPGAHLRAPRFRLLLIEGFARPFNPDCCDQGCFATSVGPYRSRLPPNCSSTTPL